MCPSNRYNCPFLFSNLPCFGFALLPSKMHVQPGEAVTEIIFVFYTDLPIAGDAIYTSRTVADSYTLSRNSPGEHSGFWIILQNFS
jgi:hypothetical protein